MAFTAVALKFFASLFILFAVKKPSLTNSSSCCFWKHHEVLNAINESFIYSSIWQLQQGKANFRHTRHVLQLLLLLAGDIEICHGPRGICCPSCTKYFGKNQSSAFCYNFKLRCHLKCITDRFIGKSEKLYCRTC